MQKIALNRMQDRLSIVLNAKIRYAPWIFVGVALLILSDQTWAATGSCATPLTAATTTTPATWAEGCELMPLYDKLKTFLDGIFVKIAGIVAVVMGIGMGMAKSSIQPAAMGIAFGVVMLAMPNIVKSFFGALI